MQKKVGTRPLHLPHSGGDGGETTFFSLPNQNQNLDGDGEMYTWGCPPAKGRKGVTRLLPPFSRVLMVVEEKGRLPSCLPQKQNLDHDEGIHTPGGLPIKKAVPFRVLGSATQRKGEDPHLSVLP